MSAHYLFVFGLGYSATHLAKRLLNQGWRIGGTCRSEEKAADLARLGIEAHVFDGTTPCANMGNTLNGVTHLLSSIPPDDAGDPALGHHSVDIENNSKALEWIGYLSTIGVYGDQGCRWIDESCPPQPISRSSIRRVAAEQQWLQLGDHLGIPAKLFRLPGIYGPGRNQLEALRHGRARRIVKPGQVFNRIHVDDIASAVIASLRKGTAGPAIYTITDDEPAPADEVITFAASLMGIEPPPAIAFDDAQLSPFAAHFYAECKRVRNDLMKRELGIALHYPTYREGLSAIATAVAGH
jgi:nucleoside-diphosphate-sugar epimerase